MDQDFVNYLNHQKATFKFLREYFDAESEKTMKEIKELQRINQKLEKINEEMLTREVINEAQRIANS